MNFSFFRQLFLPGSKETRQQKRLYSIHLNREVIVDVLLPKNYKAFKTYPLVIFNDGQDFNALNMGLTLEKLLQEKSIPDCVVVGLHCDENRMDEYGVSHTADYKNRGSKALDYSRFVTEEFLPFIRKQYAISSKKEDTFIAGFSLGGLSAFDIAWKYPQLFHKVGVFSGSFWWRSKPLNIDDPDADRIVHDMVSKHHQKENLKFWFQTGTLDETSDRNRNGVIDAIDDTLDLMKCLREKGYAEHEMEYFEIEGGRHHPHTWGDAMVDFLKWAFQPKLFK
ncbi:MAG: alpha/beta hydrolase [Saprospiraceae bacterium]